MPSLNKASLREEFDALKGKFERLCANGKMVPESRALFQAMLMLFELLVAVFMEKRTTKTSANSDLPPFQTRAVQCYSPSYASTLSRLSALSYRPSSPSIR